MKLRKQFFLLATMLILNSCLAQKKQQTVPSLKNAYKGDFYIGTALDGSQINEANPLVTAMVSK